MIVFGAMGVSEKSLGSDERSDSPRFRSTHFLVFFPGSQEEGSLGEVFFESFYMCFQNIVHLYEISPVFSTCFFSAGSNASKQR